MRPTFKTLTRRQIIAYSALILAALGIVVLYLMGGNEVFERKDEVQYDVRDEVVLPMYNVHSLAPATSTDEDTYHIAPLVYDSLFMPDETMTPTANLAENYVFDADARTLSLDLVDTSWHDGEKLKGQDVAFSIEAYKMAGEECLYYDMIQNISHADYDGRHVVIHFRYADNMALDQLYFPIIPSHKYSWYREATQEGEDFVPMGTGPYKVKTFDALGRLVLEPNEQYHGEVPKNTLIFDTDARKGDTYQLLQSGGINLLITKDEDRTTHITKKNIKIADFPANTVEYLCFNCEDVVLEDPMVRQAICYALDCQKIIDTQHYGSGMINGNLFYPGYLGVEASEERYAYDVQKAEDLFAAAGYTETNAYGYLCTDEGRVLYMNILVDTNDEEKVGAAYILEESLKDMGVQVKVAEVSTSAYKAMVRSGNFDICFGSYTFDNNMDMRAILGNEKTNYARYKNEKVIELLDELRSGKTVDEMKAIYEQLLEIVNEDVPYYCIMYPTYGAMLAPSFEGEPSPLWNRYYNGSGTWQSKYIVESESE